VATTVVWFRRDLRLHDHPALARAVSDGDRVAPLFVLDDRLLAGPARSANRLWFMRESLAALADDIARRGAPLSVARGDPVDVVPAFATRIGARRVVVSRDHAPYGRGRDDRVEARLRASGVGWEAAPGLLIQDPGTVLTAAGGPFRVFGPFQRAWLTLPTRAVLPAPDQLDGIESGDRAGLDRRVLGEVLDSIAPTAGAALLIAPGEAAARARLAAWADGSALDRYASDRDRLDRDGTSRLGADLRWGLLSPVEVAARCAGPGEGRRRFLSELAWRDFYAHLLWSAPSLARASFRPALEGVAWETEPAVVDAWRAGRTGYPVVDAAMRQLQATGWMHNRARMIVASFLTKHLGVDWRVGAAHFMEHLLDGDVASNSGGWQWAASTGTDPQPWFRVFNPTLQGRRHDPDGAYVRRWVPELAGQPDALVHEPPPGAYLPPIVDHAAARRRALDAYRTASHR
jgi:deoxyribodipyrimidine photo-lyase